MSQSVSTVAADIDGDRKIHRSAAGAARELTVMCTSHPCRYRQSSLPPYTNTSSHLILTDFLTLHCTALHYITLHSTTPHCTISHCISPHCTALRYTTLHSTTPHCALRCVPYLSYSASNSSLSGNSLDAATTASSGMLCLVRPLSNRLSFRIVKREFKMAELALKISSKNATEAVGRYP